MSKFGKLDNVVKIMFKFDDENWLDVESEDYYIGCEIMLNMNPLSLSECRRLYKAEKLAREGRHCDSGEYD